MTAFGAKRKHAISQPTSAQPSKAVVRADGTQIARRSTVLSTLWLADLQTATHEAHERLNKKTVLH